jgi:hypothetical protein
MHRVGAKPNSVEGMELLVSHNRWYGSREWEPTASYAGRHRNPQWRRAKAKDQRAMRKVELQQVWFVRILDSRTPRTRVSLRLLGPRDSRMHPTPYTLNPSPFTRNPHRPG